MHSEHAELISALRAENLRLTAQTAEMSGLQSVIDAQSKLLLECGNIIRQQSTVIEEMQQALRELSRCP